jgi:hypothetical protein
VASTEKIPGQRIAESLPQIINGSTTHELSKAFSKEMANDKQLAKAGASAAGRLLRGVLGIK